MSLCNLPAADTKFLQHSPESALWKGLLRLNDLLNIIQTFFLSGQTTKKLSTKQFAGIYDQESTVNREM